MIKKAGLFLLAFTWCYQANAGVRALGNDGDVSGQIPITSGMRFTQPNTAHECLSAGFEKTSCPETHIAVLPCPIDSHYFRDCCPKDYRFSEAYCREHNMEPSKNSCYSLYACLPKDEKNNSSE